MQWKTQLNVLCILCRCFMHSVNLLMGIVLKTPHAKRLLKDAQRLVTLAKTSTKISDYLRSKGCTSMKTRVPTRFTSAQECLLSVIDSWYAWQAAKEAQDPSTKKDLIQSVSAAC